MTFTDDTKAAGYGFFWIIVGVIAMFVVIALIFLLGLGLSWWTAPWQGKVQARQLIQGNGSYRIAAYDHFFDLCASVQTKEGTIVALQQELATKPTEERRGEIEASITANRAGRIDDINQYNADARKSYTLGQFRASGLPYTLDPTVKETRCTVG